MIQTKVKINLGDIYEEVGHIPIIPISIPTMDEIEILAQTTHEKALNYSGEAWGWPVSYKAEVSEPIPHSNMQFQPAVFTIGVYPIWFVSFTWEYGKEQAPLVLVEDENLISANPIMHRAVPKVNGQTSYR